MAYYLKCNKTKKSSLMKKISKGPFIEELIEPLSKDRERIKNMIHQTLPKLQISSFKTVKNNYLESLYLLKKAEYKSRCGKFQELLLFHITAAKNVKSIIQDNFNWRLVSRGKFGLGTSFSGDAQYADKYANNKIGNKRAIIVTKVLVCNKVEGQNGQKILHKKYDTATGNGDKVFVKFSDNEVLPVFVIFYDAGTLKENCSKTKGNQKNNSHPNTVPQGTLKNNFGYAGNLNSKLYHQYNQCRNKFKVNKLKESQNHHGKEHYYTEKEYEHDDDDDEYYDDEEEEFYEDNEDYDGEEDEYDDEEEECEEEEYNDEEEEYDDEEEEYDDEEEEYDDEEEEYDEEEEEYDDQEEEYDDEEEEYDEEEEEYDDEEEEYDDDEEGHDDEDEYSYDEDEYDDEYEEYYE